MKTDLIFDIEIKNEVDLEAVVLKIKNKLQKNSFLLLSGDLATGKTTFTRYFCQSYGLNFVQSPTYAIHQRYQNSEICIEHFDFYRLENEDDLESTGFWDILQNKDHFFLIEWPEKIGNLNWLQDKDAYQLKFSIQSEMRRLQFFKMV